MIFINSDVDVRDLREAVRSLESALEKERAHADRVVMQREHKTIEANMFATMARTLAKKYNIPKDEVRKLRAECKELCEEDLRKRGFKQFFEKPPNFVANSK